MKIFGSIRELVSLVFRTAAGKEVSVTSAVQTGTSPITVTIPDVGDSADTLVVADAAQTLTNKTLTSPTITGTGAIAGTFTGNLTGDVTGNVSGTAANVTGIVLPTKGGTGIANDASQTTTRSGNFAKTETLTNTTNVTYPTTGTLGTLGGTETLTNKLISSGAVTGPARVNVPTGTTAELSTGLTVDGSVGFDTSLDKLSVKTAAGVVTVGSGSGSGSGEINAILNPSASEAITGWSVSGAGSPAVARVATGGPLSPVIPSMIRSSGGSAAAYSFYNFTLPAALTNKKLKIEWNQAAPTSGEWKVEMRTQAGVEYALSTDSSGDSLIPAASGKYSTTFDTDSTTTLQLRFVRVAGSGNLDVSNVIVGPGIQPQGAVVGPALAFTPVFTSSSLGTITSPDCNWERHGERMVVSGTLTAGTVTGDNCTLELPLSLTAGTTSANGLRIGSWQRNNSSATARKFGNIFVIGNGSNKFVYFASDDQTAASSPFAATGANSLFNNSQIISFEFSLTIAEWSGSGVVNLAQNDSSQLAIAYKSADTTGQALATANKMTFDTEVVDANGRFTSSTYTALTAGYYEVGAVAQVVSGTTLTRVFMSVYKNGVETVRLSDLSITLGASVPTAIGGSTIISLAAGDTTEIYTFVTGTGNYSIGGGADQRSRFTMRRVNVDGQVIGFGLATATQSGLVSAEESGTFTGTLTGCTTSPTATGGYSRVGKTVTITLPALTGTSNTTACTVTTNIPATCYPARASYFVANTANAGVDVVGICNMGTTGTITLTASIAGAGFTASLAKGFDFGVTFSYTTI